MDLTSLDLALWAGGFLGHLTLLFVLFYRRLARSFPFFTALITLGVVQTIILYLVRAYGANSTYSIAYWSLTVFDTMLQLCVVYEVASRVFRPLDVWAQDLRQSFAWLVGFSVSVALALAWMESPPAHTWMGAFIARGNLFGAALMSELFVAMMALSVTARFPWRTHVAQIAQGFGVYSLLSVLIETGHSYPGIGSNVQSSILLSYVRMVVYLACVSYWIVALWRDERPGRAMPPELRQKMFTLQSRLTYDLQQLRLRAKQ